MACVGSCGCEVCNGWLFSHRQPASEAESGQHTAAAATGVSADGDGGGTGGAGVCVCV